MKGNTVGERRCDLAVTRAIVEVRTVSWSQQRRSGGSSSSERRMRSADGVGENERESGARAWG